MNEWRNSKIRNNVFIIKIAGTKNTVLVFPFYTIPFIRYKKRKKKIITATSWSPYTKK